MIVSHLPETQGFLRLPATNEAAKTSCYETWAERGHYQRREHSTSGLDSLSRKSTSRKVPILGQHTGKTADEIVAVLGRPNGAHNRTSVGRP